MSFQGCEDENEEKLFFSTLSGFSNIFLKVTMLNYVFSNLTGLLPVALLKTRLQYVSLSMYHRSIKSFNVSQKQVREQRFNIAKTFVTSKKKVNRLSDLQVSKSQLTSGL